MHLSISRITKVIGIFVFSIGLVAAFYAPYEIFVYYIFSEGGQFHYDGFGMGSLWFAIVTLMNFGYYAIAGVCLPLGYGWIKLRRWAFTLTRLFSYLWLFYGILFSIHAVNIFWSVRKINFEYDQVQAFPLFLLVEFFLLVLPLIATFFLNKKNIQQAFETQDPRQYWTERYPFSLLVVLAMTAALLVALHFAIFLQGIFPWFGQILIGRSSARLIALNILLLGFLLFGLVKINPWARWGSIVYFALLLVSSAMTFSRYNLYEIISIMQLPLQEIDVIHAIKPLLQVTLLGLTALPLLMMLGLLISSGSHFKKD